MKIKDLYKKPYTSIDFPMSNAELEKSIESFFAFLTLPDFVKKHMDYKISPLHRRGDLGFKRRDSDDHIYNDNKDFFHYHPIFEKIYSEFIDQYNEISAFCSHASVIWRAVYKKTKEVLSHFEEDYPGTLGNVFNTDAPHIILRFLRYDYPKSGKYLAKPHFDSGSFTLAIAESKPGLRIGTNPGDLELVTHQENSALFMISSNFKKIIDDDRLKPAWHDVIQTDESLLGKPFSRWAIVAFIDGYNVASLERNETHKFFQESL